MTRPSPLFELLHQVTGAAPTTQPWQVDVDAAVWERLARRVAGEPDWTLVDLWGEADRAHLALADVAAGAVAVATLRCPDGRFPSVGRHHVPAIRLERALTDLHGLLADGTPDERPWLDHGRWPSSRAHPTYPFLPVEGEALHQIPVGPVHAGIIEPGHFRFTAAGETVVRLEARLGYVHKGIDALLKGASIERAAALAARTSGDSTVAFSFAFARAVEQVLGVEAPPRAVWLRAVMAELERIANHLGDFGAICNDASFAIVHAHCGVLRETVLRATAVAFGHRLAMDRVVPGGVAADLDEAGVAAIAAATSEVRARLPSLVELYDNTASLQDRTAGTGVLGAELARRFGAGGYVGRASGRAVDARRTFAYAPYDRLEFAVPVRTAGDVDARVWVRIEEIRSSLALIDALLAGLPGGAVSLELPSARTEATGCAIGEGFRGDVFAWVRFAADGTLAAGRLRDPSWFQWPLLEAAVEGNIVADFPLCNKSFNCSYSGHDL